MRKFRVVFLSFLIFLLLSAPFQSSAQEEPKKPGEEIAKPQKEDRLPIHKQDEWQFFLSPYMWIPGVNASTTTFNKTTTVDAPWYDIVPDLFSKAIGTMGRFEVWKGRWGAFLDGYYVYTGTSGSQSGATHEKTFGPYDFRFNKQINIGGENIILPIPVQIGPANLTMTPSGSIKYIGRMGNLDLGVRFLAGTVPLSSNGPIPVMSFEILGGGRYNYCSQYIRMNLSSVTVANIPVNLGGFSLTRKYERIENGTYTLTFNRSFIEPFLGTRLGFWFTTKIVMYVTGDLGGFGLVADENVDCNLEALLGYKVHKNIYLWAGYRAHGVWFTAGEALTSLNLNGWLHGPVLGATFAF